MGARPLRRLIQDEIEDELSEKLLRNEFGAGDTVELDFIDGAIVVQTPKKKRKPRRTKSSPSDSDDKQTVSSTGWLILKSVKRAGNSPALFYCYGKPQIVIINSKFSQY
jgi:hypothetical protein